MFEKNLFKLLTAVVLLCGTALLHAENKPPLTDIEAAKKLYTTPLTVTPMDATVTIKKNTVILAPKKEGAVYTLSGYFNGQIINKTKNTEIKLNGVYLENTRGAAALFGELKTEISTVSGTENYIVSSGTSKEKSGAVMCRKDIVLGGSGTLYVIGSVWHGIKGDDIKIKGSGTHYLKGTANGAALSCETLTVEPGKTFTAWFCDSKNGIKADAEITISSGTFCLYNNGTALKTDKNKDSPGVTHAITLKGGTFRVHGNETLYTTETNAYHADGATFVEE